MQWFLPRTVFQLCWMWCLFSVPSLARIVSGNGTWTGVIVFCVFPTVALIALHLTCVNATREIASRRQAQSAKAGEENDALESAESLISHSPSLSAEDEYLLTMPPARRRLNEFGTFLVAANCPIQASALIFTAYERLPPGAPVGFR